MFKGLNSLVDLSVKLVETKRDKIYDWVYFLLKMVLLLPVATTSVERVFCGMTFVKCKLRNRMGDSVLDACLGTFIERDIFLQVSEDDIINTFMAIRSVGLIRRSSIVFFFNYYGLVRYVKYILNLFNLSYF